MIFDISNQKRSMLQNEYFLGKEYYLFILNKKQESMIKKHLLKKYFIRIIYKHLNYDLVTVYQQQSKKIWMKQQESVAAAYVKHAQILKIHAVVFVILYISIMSEIIKIDDIDVQLLHYLFQLATFETQNPVTTIVDNWKMKPIQEINLLTLCEDEVLNMYRQPAISRGCFCSPNTVKDNYCSDYDKSFGCKDVSPQPPIDLPTWAQLQNNGTYIGLQICVKRANQSFYDQIKMGIRSRQDCLNSKRKVCETNDQLYFSCVDSSEQCPINDILLQSSPLTNEELQLNYWELVINSTFYLYTTRVAAMKPLVIGKVVKGRGVCLYSSQLSLNPLYSVDYKLNFPSATQCSLDQRYRQKSITPETQFFDINNQTQVIQSTRPAYQISDQVKYQFMIMNQIYLSQFCSSSILDELFDLQFNFDQTYNTLIAQLVLACVFFVVMMFLIANELCLLCYEKRSKKYYFLLIRWFFQFGFSITIYIVYAYVQLSQKTIKNQIDRQCYDQITTNGLQFVITDMLDVVITLSNTLLILVIILTVIDCLIAIFRAYNQFLKHKKRRQVHNQQYIGQANSTPVQQQQTYY
ncbi:hypothetical protein pb186bvf_018547 [Paramecium bursaria]